MIILCVFADGVKIIFVSTGNIVVYGTAVVICTYD